MMGTPDTLANPSRSYDLKKFSFMAPQGPHMPVTETYVSIPPALWIRQEGPNNQMNVWTLGFDYNEVEWRTGKLEYDVCVNGVKTGEFARNIEMKTDSYGKRVVRIWGADGWRTFNGRIFV
jgi:hypothetical protein